jgi:hypothetical protein
MSCNSNHVLIDLSMTFVMSDGYVNNTGNLRLVTLYTIVDLLCQCKLKMNPKIYEKGGQIYENSKNYDVNPYYLWSSICLVKLFF